MGLLNPALLVLGVATAVPIILHLFQRHQGPRVVFPALRYLRRAEKESARQIKLRQLLLMLLRVAAVLLLAVAAARPFALSGGAGHEPTAVVIILDNSMSTDAVVGDRRVLDELKELALASLDHAGPDDRFWLLRAGAPWEPALPGDPAATAARVRETEPTAAAADLRAALAHARALLAAGGEGRAAEIQLLSDMQATSFPSGAAPPGDGPAVVVWATDARPPRNVTVASVEIGGGLAPRAGERSNAVAVVEGTAGEDSVRVRLSLDGRVVAAAAAPLGAGAVLPLPGRPAGLYAGWVETDPDALRADDRRFFTMRVVPPPAVAVTSDLAFVEEALAVMEAAGRVRRAPLANADVAILAAGARLESVPDDRTAIVLPPDAQLELPAINRRLGEAGIPWRYEPAAATGESRFAIDTLADPLMRPLERVRLTQVYALRPQGAVADTVLLRLREGLDWAVRGERARGGHYILLASPLSPAATTVPTSAAMVPLLDRLVGTWAAAQPASSDVQAGETITLPEGTTALRHPDGVVDAAAPGEFRTGPEQGVYQVLAGNTVLNTFAVNSPRAESELGRLERRRIREVIGGREVVLADSRAEWLNDTYRSRLGHELWRLALAFVLLVLAVEASVAATGRPRHERGRTDPASASLTSPQRPAPLSGATAGTTESG